MTLYSPAIAFKFAKSSLLSRKHMTDRESVGVHSIARTLTKENSVLQRFSVYLAGSRFLASVSFKTGFDDYLIDCRFFIICW